VARPQSCGAAKRRLPYQTYLVGFFFVKELSELTDFSPRGSVAPLFLP
jgi:hypothetical protein